MVGCRYWWPILGLLSASVAATMAKGQVEPRSPVHVTVNGVFFLCPKLVRNDGAFPANELSGLGFVAETEPGSSALRFKGIGDRGLLVVSYERAEKRCLLDYSGPGYSAIAGVVRDTVTQNGFTRITGGDQGGAKADVFEGPTPDRTKTVRIIIIENSSQPSAAISYVER